MKPQMANWVRMTKLSRLMAVVTFVSLAGMLACSDDNPSGSSADVVSDPDIVTFQLVRSLDTPDLTRGPVLNPGEEILYELKLVKKVIDPDAGTTLLFPDSEELYGDEGHRLNIGEEAMDRHRTVEEVQNFLESHWDAHHEGGQDPGWNSEELLDYLQASNLSHDLLIEHFEESGAPDLTEFLDFVNHAADQTALSVGQVFSFFEHTHIPYSGVINQLAVAGVTPDELWAAMAQAEYNFDDLANLYLSTDPLDFSVAVENLVNGPPLVAMADPPSAAYAKVALDASKFAYQVIKDNAPQTELDLSNNIKVLNPLDLDWTNYYGIQDDRGQSYSWTVNYTKLFGPTISAVDVSWQTIAKRSNQHDVIPGYYIPSLYPIFQVAKVDWGHTLNASYKIANPSNMASGPSQPTIACLPYIVTLNLKTLIQNWTYTWDAVANAKHGIDRVRCVGN